RAGDTNQGTYPIFSTAADGNPIAIVNTDGNYQYVGRLVIDFDANGNIVPESYDPAISGAYATDEQGVADLNAAGLVDPEIQAIVNAVGQVVAAVDGTIFGSTTVFLNGTRSDVRTQETNFGNLTADANLAYAKTVDPTTVISIKNGGGIRSDIGVVTFPPGSTDPNDVLRLPPAANPLAGKEEGDISQLDITNSLSFNNGLSLVTVTAQELLTLLEVGVSGVGPGQTPGAFPQVSGLQFSFNPAAAAGNRVQSLAVVNEQGEVADLVVRGGEVVGDPNRTFRVVTLGFLASGGDGYPFPNRDRIDLNQPDGSPRTGAATFANDGSEQDALAEYLLANFPSTETPFSQADTSRLLDTRIQNLAQRVDSVDESQLFSLTGRIEGAGAEITAYDPQSQRLFVTTGSTIDIISIANPNAPQKVGEIDITALGAGVNSVAVRNGLVAAAIDSAPITEPGVVAFFTTDGTLLNSVTVGALPDMLTFTPDGAKVLVANEGEPSNGVNPNGSISIIDLSNGAQAATVAEASFTALNGQEDALRAQGIRIFPGVAAAADFEPEYIAVSPDGAQAFVTLQENNAVAVVDIASAQVLNVLPLGAKNHSLAGNSLDASDRDGAINLRNWPVFGLYMPDAIASVAINGQTYYLTANEGDDRGETARVSQLVLDPVAFPNASVLQRDENLGRLTVSAINGDTDGDGDYDQLFAYGGRSFTIWDGAGNLVFDSGDQIERILASLEPGLFNADNGSSADFDTRSDNKGPEPEAVTVGFVGNTPFAFVGLERGAGGVLAYDISNPAAPVFVQYIRSAEDISPEGVLFIPAADSPNGQNLLVLSHEVSNTVTIYQTTQSDPGPIPLPVLDPNQPFFISFEQLVRGAEAVGFDLSYTPRETGRLSLGALFDETYYLGQNPDVFQAVSSGVLRSGYDHFAQFGQFEGRDPSLFFDEDFYLANNPDVGAALGADVFSSGFQHFAQFGHLEGRSGSGVFSEADYLTGNPDVAAAVSAGVFGSGFEHYAEFGIREGRGPAVALYNEAFYLGQNPDVAAAVQAGIFADGFEHFLSFGSAEGRDPSALFSESAYLASNPDVAAAVDSEILPSGFAHYAFFGRPEGRAIA
ncbi:MAG TPA: choice-of-anchor I family protein, partial [Trichocoleus sp.]